MVFGGGGRPLKKGDEVAHVLGQKCALLRLQEFPQLEVGEGPDLSPFAYREDVAASPAKLLSYPSRVVLVEAEPHARTACSRRQASSSRSAMECIRSVHSSTSSG